MQRARQSFLNISNSSRQLLKNKNLRHISFIKSSRYFSSSKKKLTCETQIQQIRKKFDQQVLINKQDIQKFINNKDNDQKQNDNTENSKEKYLKVNNIKKQNKSFLYQRFLRIKQFKQCVHVRGLKQKNTYNNNLSFTQQNLRQYGRINIEKPKKQKSFQIVQPRSNQFTKLYSQNIKKRVSHVHTQQFQPSNLIKTSQSPRKHIQSHIKHIQSPHIHIQSPRRHIQIPLKQMQNTFRHIQSFHREHVQNPSLLQIKRISTDTIIKKTHRIRPSIKRKHQTQTNQISNQTHSEDMDDDFLKSKYLNRRRQLVSFRNSIQDDQEEFIPYNISNQNYFRNSYI